MSEPTVGHGTREPGVLVLNGPIPPPYGGIATFLGGVLPEIARRGVRVVTAVPRGYSSDRYAPPQTSAVTIVSARRNGRLHQLRRLAITALRWRRELWSWKAVHGLRLREAAQILDAWLPECEAVLRSDPTITTVHAYDEPWSVGWVAACLAERYRKRFVISTFGELLPHIDLIEPLDEVSDAYRGISRQVLDAADKVVAPSAFCRAKLSHLGFDPAAADIVYPVIGLERFAQPTIDLPDRYGLGSDPVVLFVGQLRPRKGADVLIDAAPAIRASAPDTKIVIAGPDEGSLDLLRHQAVALGVDRLVQFIGPVPDPELVALYRRAQVFVFPTVSEIECLGLSFIQAMYAGTAVVASRIAAVPEVIDDEVSGLLFAPGDASGLAAQTVRLLLDEGLRRRVAEQAAARVGDMFDRGQVITSLVSLYRAP